MPDLVTGTDSLGVDFQVSQCYTYDPFNRLASAWTIDETTTSTCGAAPGTTDDFWDVAGIGYATTWDYADTGQILTRHDWSVDAGTVSVTTNTYASTDTNLPHAVPSVHDGATTDSYGYDTAGRMVSRTIDGTTTTLTWDALSNMTTATTGGVETLMLYDASGQREPSAVSCRFYAGAGIGDVGVVMSA